MQAGRRASSSLPQRRPPAAGKTVPPTRRHVLLTSLCLARPQRPLPCSRVLVCACRPLEVPCYTRSVNPRSATLCRADLSRFGRHRSTLCFRPPSVRQHTQMRYVPLPLTTGEEPSSSDSAIAACFRPHPPDDKEGPPEWAETIFGSAWWYRWSSFSYCGAGAMILLRPEPMYRHAEPWRRRVARVATATGTATART